MRRSGAIRTTDREIPLGTVRLLVRQTNVDINDIHPNPEQPRYGPKDDAELRRSIEENGGIFIPLLVEPHPKYEGKYQIIDGERRWTSLKRLVEEKADGRFKIVPVDLTDRILGVEERLRAWVYIHQQRKEWTVKEKERTAYKLIQIVGRVSAASILGIKVREVDALKEIFELSEEISGLSDPDASISYAREIRKIAKYLRPPDVEAVIIGKINQGLMNTSKDIRLLRRVLKDDAARQEFMRDGSTVADALGAIGPSSGRDAARQRYGQSIAEDIKMFTNSLSRYSWTALKGIENREELVRTIKDCHSLLGQLEEALT